MGGTQSQYMCDEHVAAHIKSRPFLEQELNSCVQGKAKLASFDVVDGNGVISYTLENGATVVECKSKLDEFFKKFMTFSESYDPQKIPFHLPSHMLHAGVDCTVKWDNPNHNVQITGNKNDVKEVIKKLREYQNPTLPPAVSTAPPPPTVTVNNNLPPKSFGFTYPLAQFQTTSVQPNTTTSSVTTANAPSNAPINPLPTPSPPSGPSTSSSAHQPPETFTYDIEIGQPPRTPTPDPLTEFVMVAPQFAVARFIKYSREERSRMETCLYKAGDVEIVENAEKKLEYIIRPRQYLVLPKTQKEYEKKCRKELLAYLDNYSSYFRKFNREVLHSAMERNPFYFNDRSPRENRIVFVRWYMDDSKVLVAGPKQEVENELDRIYSVLQIPRPEKLATFELYIENPEIAQFIESSTHYRELLLESFDEIATVKTVRKQRNIAFKFSSMCEVDEDAVEMFKDSCNQMFNEFASQFSHWSSKYPANQIQKATRQSSFAFTCTQDVTVKVDNSSLSIIGLNELVEGRKDEMFKAMQMARKKISSHRCPANDYHVAEFINQSSARMNELKQSFSRIATLKIVAKGKDKLEYQFTSNEEMLPEDQTQFKSECLVKLNKFLVKFTSWEKTYPPSVLKMALMDNDPYLQCITGPRLVRFLHENKFVLVGVKSCVENMKTEISNMMEHYQREHQRLTYQFSLPVAPKDYYVASFINNSPTHMEQLVQELSAVCQISFIENTNILARFTSVDMVSPHFVPAFEKDCLDRMLNFFNHHFSCWKSLQYNAQRMEKVLETYPALQGLQSDNVKVRIEADSLVVTGLKGEVDNRRQMILDAIQLKNNGQQGGGSSKNSSTSFPTNSRRSSATGSEEGNQPKAANTSRGPRKKILSHRCPANDYHVAEFINQSSARMNELKRSFSRIATLKIVAKGKDKLEYQFTSNEEMLPEDQTQFKSECLEKLNKFLVKFTSWEKTYPPSVLKMAAMNNDPYLQSIAGHRLERFLHENKFVLVGVKSCVENMKTEILNMMEHYQREHQRLTYQFSLPVAPKDYHVASFINNSPTHMEQLVQELSAVCQISFIENTDILARFTSVDMVSPHFVPAFEKDCLDRMLNFFNHHFSCWKSLQYNAQMMEKVLETYPALQGLQSDNVQVKIDGPYFVITGVKGEVDNRRQVILDAIQLRNNGQQGGGSSKNSSRRSSATGSEEGNQPKAANTSRRPRNRERSSAGGSQEIKPYYSFEQPKLKNFDKIIDYVFNTPAHIGSLSEQVGKATKIQRHPKARNPKVKFITRVEAKNALPASELRKIAQTFFKQFSCWSQSFPQEQIDQADKNSPELVDKLKDNPVSIQWNNNTAIVVGLSENVEAFSAALKKALQQDKEIEMEYSSQNALHLIKCGAIEEISKKYKDSIVILFSLGKLKFKGKESKVKEVIKEVQEMNLIDTNLEMVEEKLLLLKTALNCVEPCVYNREFVENEIEKQNLKAAIEVENDEVHLMTMTNEMSAQAVAILNNMITTHQIEIPSDISPLVKLKTLQDKLNKFTKCYVVKIKENVLELILFVGDDTKLIEEAKSYLNSCCPDSRVLEFTPGVTRFIGKYWLNDESCSLVPSSFSTKVLEQGIEFTGPPDVLDTVIEKLVNKNLDCHNFSYSSPKLSTLLEEIKWKAFVTFLEATHRCTVTAATDSAFAPTKSRFNERNNALNDIAKVSEAMFGKVKVKIVVGDITEEYSDVIINGATSDFVLSRGTVSSALLKVAGPAMQDQCNNNPVMTYPAVNPSIRVTDSFNLLCYHVVHLVTPRQSSQLAVHIKDAMEVADMMKAKSVSIPTLGAGGIGLDCGEVASAMCEAFAQFAESIPSCVREIRVVVYETSIVEIFKRGITVCMGLTNYLESCWLRFKHDKPQEDNLSIQIVCDDQSCLDQVKHEVEKHMKSVVVTKTISDDAIHNMSDHDRIEVFDISCDGLVNVELQQNSIKLQGLDENVGKVYELVRDKLRDIKYQPTNGVWEWSFGGNKFHPLPMRVCQQLENYKNRGGVNVITVYGHSLTVTGMNCELNGIKGKLKQPDYKEQATSNDLPSSWSNMDGRSCKKVELRVGSQEYDRVSQLFWKSSPRCQGIVKIERIQNPSLYKQYNLRKKDVKEHMVSSHPVERELFHGTSQNDADTICTDGFNRSFAGKNATLYGKGSYFAVDSSYSMVYASSCMFLASVITGDYCQGRQSMIVPDVKPGRDRRYDSAVNSTTNPTIFVSFSDPNVYPSYLLTLR